MLKIAGAVFVLLSAAVLSASLSAAERRRVKTAEALYNLSLFIQNRVECFLQPVNVIAAAFENDFLEECGFLPAVRERGVEDALPLLPFEREYGGALRRFCAQSGGGYKTEQLALCRELCEFYSAAADSARAAMPKKIKLYTGLPPLAAVAAIMMFL